MGDNKISEAVRKLAYETCMWYSQNEKCQPGVPFYAFTQGELDRFVEKLSHLQGDAVPVAYIEHSADKLLQMTLTPDGLALGVGRHPVFAHPQPAELSEVSGDSGELADGPVHAAIEDVLSYASHHESCGDSDSYNNAEIPSCGCGFDAAVERLEAALAATGKQQVGEAEPANDDWHLRGYAYASKQATTCASCGKHKHTPLRIDAMGGYVCLTCIDQKLGTLLNEFGYQGEQVGEVQGVVPYAVARDLLADSYNAGRNGIGFSEQVMRLDDALAARQPGADEPVSPMAKMAAALREKAAIEHTEYSQRVQSGEWGTMPEAGTQADFCRYCEGSGWDGESRKTKCPDCSGTGMSRLLIGEAG